jgi:hypothetical protein
MIGLQACLMLRLAFPAFTPGRRSDSRRLYIAKAVPKQS